MGQSASAQYERNKEKPNAKTQATLYYFSGRGLADQIRWLLAATNITFTHKAIDDRKLFLKMTERQLPFGQLPMLQIDGVELVQTQAIIRYLARRANIAGETPADEVKCDMMAETIRDLVNLITQAPFHRFGSSSGGEKYKMLLKDKWNFVGQRFEVILAGNGGQVLVGTKLTYVDILLAHILTWYVEECGPEIVTDMPHLIELQNTILSMNSIKEFIRGPNYFPISDDEYCRSVSKVLGRNES